MGQNSFRSNCEFTWWVAKGRREFLRAATKCAVLTMVFLAVSLLAPSATKASDPSVPASPSAVASPSPKLEDLGIAFVEGSTSSLIVERNGKRYVVDLVSRSVKETESSPTPTPAAPLTTQELTEGRQNETSAAQSKPQEARVYEPGDDYIFSLPTGRRLDRHGFYVNFNHRFAFEPAFSGATKGGTLLGLDNFAIASFGFRYGLTARLSAGIYRSPTIIGRPIELMAAYNLADEHDGHPLNAAVRFSVDGQDHFTKNFSMNFEGIVSRSLGSRAQIYLVPTLTLNSRRLVLPPFPGPIANLPGTNTFSLGVGGALDIRPTVALVAEAIPTLVNGRELGIHRPAFSFGIQKKIWRHAFTFGWSNSPGTTVSQRSGTRATYLEDPSADTPAGLFIGFDLTRQIY
jgi:hypothetical protein